MGLRNNLYFLGQIILSLSIVSLAAKKVDNEVNIWPMPVSVSHGNRVLYMSKTFELKTNGSKYKDVSGILKDGFSRLLDVIKAGHVIDDHSGGGVHHLTQIQGIHVVILSPNDTLIYGIDESYKLLVPAEGKPVYAHIQANTVYGALHGLETFSQLCYFNFKNRKIEVRHVPCNITDQPRFSYRGILIDTARHYQPISMIKKVIDSMAYAKLNVLHWHIVDTQSFPLEIPSYPNLWRGSYSASETYTMADAAAIVSYAQRRGIHVLAEIDVPGHALSWGIGYPQLWPSRNCKEPLDVSNEFVFKLIDGILSDFSKVFKFKFVHLGGDEVDTSCWETTPHIKKWMNEHKMVQSQAYEYFVLRAQKIASSHGYEIINWEETFNNFGSKLNRNTVVHNWIGPDVAPQVVAAGFRCIVSNQDKWYLDHLDTPWQDFYMNEPLSNITNPKHQKLVIGGEVGMWGEHVDGSDIEQTIWPRAAAAAERLWTPYVKLAKNVEEVEGRLSHFRCLLNQRGVAAAPLNAPGREAPDGPGSCFMQ
ncbi:beta-hexosaminidase 3-like [Impatiens glandulifera]|uniref:beta-hexosaminidase 3-like n=1 Tax=Impatiens glandulifera TaxID=253017 RepID=UPI001FB15A21|nr:beta-hexosaminidase 3-like [Impatiens glandulifera]